METYCTTCQTAAQRLTLLLETRRSGRLYQPPDGARSGDQDPPTPVATFGTVREITKRNGECLSCRDLHTEMARWTATNGWKPRRRYVVGILAEESPPENTTGVLPAIWLTLRVWNPEATYNRRNSRTYYRYLVDFFPTAEGGPLDRRGRLFDRTAVDVDLLKHWMRCCSETHADVCNPNLTGSLPPSACPAQILLVDLESRCLRWAPLSTPYAALSYVWGRSNTLRTTTCNLSRHLEPGGLDFGAEELPIPATLRDFARLSLRLGFRHVWIDSLCVVQDGPGLQEQLDGMAAVYASAHLTVVAEGPSADYGLIGTGDGAKPRDRPCNQLRLPGNLTCTFDDNSIPRGKPRVWEERGWTLQEWVCSTRLLNFDYYGMASWGCPTHFWGEESRAPTEALDWARRFPRPRGNRNSYRLTSLAGKLDFAWPDMRLWCQVVEDYARRQLSFDGDGLNAVAGIMALLQSKVPGGFFSGIPELFFDMFLLWDVTESHISDRRDTADIPSWSCFAWKGGHSTRMDLFWWRWTMDHTLLDDTFDGYGSDCVVESIVKWYKKSESLGLVPISNHYHTCRSEWTQRLPEGWRRHEGPDGGRTFYTHESTGDFKFGYPIPLATTQPASNPRDFSSHLFFKAQRAWLQVGSPIKHSRRSPVPQSEQHRVLTNAELLDDGGNWAGAIRLRHDEITGDGGNRTRLELIAISRGKIPNKSFPKPMRYGGDFLPDIPEWDCKERLDQPSDEFYEFYFVMYIQRKDGIAYRRGLGRVKRGVWERLNRDEIDVVLG